MAFSSYCPYRRTMSYSALCVIVVCICAGLSSCSRDGADKTYRIAVIPKGTTHVFWKSVQAGARQAEAALNAQGKNVKITWQGPLKEDDRQKQTELIESFIGMDGIVVAPLDSHAMKGPVDRAMAAGTPVVIIDSGLDSESYVSFVATDNYKGGVLAAERMGELLGGTGEVLLLRYAVGSASTTKREQGFIDTIQQKFPEIKLLPPGLQQYAGATVGHAQEASETLLNTYPEVDGIFCPNESAATGMLQALRNRSIIGKVQFVGFDANEKLTQAIRDGYVHGLILQDPVKMGRVGVEKMVEHLEGKTVPRRIDTGVYLITKENMDEPTNQRLLEPDLSILGE